MAGSYDGPATWYKIFTFSADTEDRSFCTVAFDYAQAHGLGMKLIKLYRSVPLGHVTKANFSETGDSWPDGLLIFGRGIAVKVFGVTAGDVIRGKLLFQEGMMDG